MKMKTGIALLAGFFFSLNCQSQTLLFHEDFESPSFDDSVHHSNPSSMSYWVITDTLASQGQYAIAKQVESAQQIYMSTNSFSTLAYSTLRLHFDHICKIDFLDIAKLEVSLNEGLTWQELTSSSYLGSGEFGSNGNRFASNSYGALWLPGNPFANPQNSWWRTEVFDISMLAGLPNAMVRFRLADGGPLGPNGNAGWFIDHIRVFGEMGMSGTVFYNNQAQSPLANVQVLLTQGPATIATTSTALDGSYVFPSIAPGNYTIQVQCNYPWGGVNATDALRVLTHFVGSQVLTGIQLQAADVSGDGNVNSLDALMITKRFAGLISNFPVGNWVFQSQSFTIPSPMPLAIPVRGLCYGDVNASHIP